MNNIILTIILIPALTIGVAWLLWFLTVRAKYCSICGAPAERRRQNTAYADDSLNWVVQCDECFAETQAYWEERWAEYHADCL